jgi:CRISPR system Cascade subunit CasC
MKRQIRLGHESIIGTSTPEDTSLRTKFFPERILKDMVSRGHKGPEVIKVLKEVFGKVEEDKTSKALKVSSLQLLSTSEEKFIQSAVDLALTTGKSPGSFEVILKDASSRCGSSVAVYGRMFADSPSMDIEAASYHSQMLTTHESEPETDFFTAVEEDPQGQGSGHLDTKSFGSGVFHRSHVLDLVTLKETLKESKDIPSIIEGFIRSCVEAFPTARQHSDFSRNPPSYVAITLKTSGQPISMMGAFSKPVRGSNLLEDSIKALRAHRSNLFKVYGSPQTLLELNTLEPNTLSLDELLQKVLANV